MKTPSMSAIGFSAVGLTAVLLAVIGPPGSRKALTPSAASDSSPAPSSVSANGFTLASASVDLPADDEQYPAGPNADAINANCTSCHSASMGLTQPALSADQWKATVLKMRETYHAPVAAKDVPAIVAYLTALSAKQGAAATGVTKNPDPAGSRGAAAASG